MAWAVDRSRFIRHITVGSAYPSTTSIYNATMESRTLACGCRVDVARDGLGRAVGTIVEKGASCTRADHDPGHVVIMPGREHARQE